MLEAKYIVKQYHPGLINSVLESHFLVMCSKGICVTTVVKKELISQASIRTLNLCPRSQQIA